MAQQGYKTDMVEAAFQDAVNQLQSKGVVAIMADCGFMVTYNDLVRKMADVPVMLSSVCQLAQVELMLNKQDQIAILTANSDTFVRPAMQQVLRGLGARGESFDSDYEVPSRFVVVGCQDIPGFDAIHNGTKEDVDLIGNGIQERMQEIMSSNANIKAILIECSMMGPYSNRLR